VDARATSGPAAGGEQARLAGQAACGDRARGAFDPGSVVEEGPAGHAAAERTAGRRGVHRGSAGVYGGRSEVTLAHDFTVKAAPGADRLKCREADGSWSARNRDCCR